ncbi:MAG: hypothetical protein U5J97_01910 [Trueperaceae bacterium]|nr:hypothetical protein [Trueperaceae bacterium]
MSRAIYIVDVYGQIRDELNRGLPTDRLVVDWWIDDSRVVARAEQRMRPSPRAVENMPDVLVTRQNDGGPYRHLQGWRVPDADEVRLELPFDLLRLKEDDPELAVAWRHASREALLHLFAQGFVVKDVRVLDDRPFYVLEAGHGEREVKRTERLVDADAAPVQNT